MPESGIKTICMDKDGQVVIMYNDGAYIRSCSMDTILLFKILEELKGRK